MTPCPHGGHSPAHVTIPGQPYRIVLCPHEVTALYMMSLSPHKAIALRVSPGLGKVRTLQGVFKGQQVLFLKPHIVNYRKTIEIPVHKLASLLPFRERELGSGRTTNGRK